MVTIETRKSPTQKLFNQAVKTLSGELKDVPYIPKNLSQASRSALERLAELKIFNHPDTKAIINNVTGQLSETTSFTRQLVNQVIIETLGKKNMLDPQYVTARLETTYNTDPISQNFTSQADIIDLIIKGKPKIKNHPEPVQPMDTLQPHEFFIHLGAQMLFIEYPVLADPIIEKLKQLKKISLETNNDVLFHDLSVQDKDTVTRQFIAFINHNQLTINSSNLTALIA